MSTVYKDYYEITELQYRVMKVVDDWVRTEKTPTPHAEIIKRMKKQGVKDFNTANAITALLLKGYIRRAVVTSNKSFYVMLRKV